MISMTTNGMEPVAKIEIFSGPNCGFCASAKRLLDQKGMIYIDFDIVADDANREELLRRLPRSRSIPQIFINGEHIGGYDDLCLIDASGRLRDMTGIMERS